MTSGRTMHAILLASICLAAVVRGEAPAASAGAAAGYPSTYYTMETAEGHQGYASPVQGGYGTPSPAPSPVYGPPPAPTYGVPAGGYEPAQPFRGYGLDSESPFVQQRLFNTAVALTVPLFSFQLPQRSSTHGGLDLANQAIFGVFALFVVALVFAVPVLFTKPPGSSGRSAGNGIMDHLMANQNVINFMGADLTNKVGLDTTKCLQKSICEAHRTPKKYGMLATPFQMFFPPPTNGTSDAKSTIFQIAAKEGKYTKKDCGKKYNCFFDTLDLATYMVDWWKHSSDPNYVLEI